MNDEDLIYFRSVMLTAGLALHNSPDNARMVLFRASQKTVNEKVQKAFYAGAVSKDINDWYNKIMEEIL